MKDTILMITKDIELTIKNVIITLGVLIARKILRFYVNAAIKEGVEDDKDEAIDRFLSAIKYEYDREIMYPEIIRD